MRYWICELSCLLLLSGAEACQWSSCSPVPGTACGVPCVFSVVRAALLLGPWRDLAMQFHLLLPILLLFAAINCYVSALIPSLSVPLVQWFMFHLAARGSGRSCCFLSPAAASSIPRRQEDMCARLQGPLAETNRAKGSWRSLTASPSTGRVLPADLPDIVALWERGRRSKTPSVSSTGRLLRRRVSRAVNSTAMAERGRFYSETARGRPAASLLLSLFFLLLFWGRRLPPLGLLKSEGQAGDAYGDRQASSAPASLPVPQGPACPPSQKAILCSQQKFQQQHGQSTRIPGSCGQGSRPNAEGRQV